VKDERFYKEPRWKLAVLIPRESKEEYAEGGSKGNRGDRDR
jgi:hypothetical protein